MANINERVDQLLTKHDLDLIRFSNGQVKDVMKDINGLQKEIVGLLKEVEPSNRSQLQALLDRVDNAIENSYSAIAAKSVKSFQELAVVESQAVSSVAQKAFTIPIAPNILPQGIGIEIVENGIMPNNPDGLPLKERWTRQKEGLKSNTKTGLGYAIKHNQSLDDMLKFVRGTRNLGFRDGVMAKSKTGAETIIRTATDTVVNSARIESYKRNSDAIEGIQANAILDNRTTLLCRTRNGWAWHLQTGKPFRGTPVEFMGEPPWHFNCRTTLSPIFKSLEDLQGVLDKELNREIAKRGQNFPIDGKPAPIPSFARSINAMGSKEQERVLGKGRYELFKENKITLSDLVNQQGRTLTIKELKNLNGS